MSNLENKPMLSAHDLVEKMCSKGITFNYVSKSETEEYLDNINNYLRAASYRANYEKYKNGINKEKYINLDFSYLQELSIIDMHLRFLVNKMCLDVEHAMKVQLISDIEKDTKENGYSIVTRFINQYPKLKLKIEKLDNSSYTNELLEKYIYKNDSKTNKANYDDCPIWVLCEFLSFGDFIRLYELYYSNAMAFNYKTLNLVRALRNASAHNNCLLVNLRHGTSYPPKDINIVVNRISKISKAQISKKLSSRIILELVALFYVYNNVVVGEVKTNRVKELKWLFYDRMTRSKEMFQNNNLIRTSYEFICKVIDDFFKDN